jgi:hypothetical protein
VSVENDPAAEEERESDIEPLHDIIAEEYDDPDDF